MSYEVTYDEAKAEVFDVLVPENGLLFRDCSMGLGVGTMEVKGVAGGRVYCDWPQESRSAPVSMPLSEWWFGLFIGELELVFCELRRNQAGTV